MSLKRQEDSLMKGPPQIGKQPTAYKQVPV